MKSLDLRRNVIDKFALEMISLCLPNVKELLLSSYFVSVARILEEEDVRLYYQQCAEDIALEIVRLDHEVRKLFLSCIFYL